MCSLFNRKTHRHSILIVEISPYISSTDNDRHGTLHKSSSGDIFKLDSIHIQRIESFPGTKPSLPMQLCSSSDPTLFLCFLAGPSSDVALSS